MYSYTGTDILFWQCAAVFHTSTFVTKTENKKLQNFKNSWDLNRSMISFFTPVSTCNLFWIYQTQIWHSDDRALWYIHSLVFSLRGRAGRNQNRVMWPVWLWHTASWASSWGVVFHCFLPPLDVPTFAARCLHVRNDSRDPSSERWDCGQEICSVILPKFRLPRKNLEIFYISQIYDIGPTVLLPLRRKACWGFFRPKYPTASAEFEPANLGTKGQHVIPRPRKQLL